ncbi:TetR/AcrR family transcriptional regulator [Variovorax sp. PBL-E5]|uniref:TetR/AcrR family transcriptional regulator n=1 Tax=Variovorax sp. PBL-E5 TaxID=434014 RepID=UPI001319A6C8|nr:TetR family transcriptional regulator [Variovorax sp. PBL-E5]VTU30818.1 Potential acrAB operon repressor [Variovorax sp. PBL-E5]
MSLDSNNSPRTVGGTVGALVLPRRRGRRKIEGLVEARRQQILTAALDLFGTKGFHRTTTQDLAERADVSVGLIYQYFKDKEDLLAAAIGQIFDAYLNEIPLAVRAARDPLSRFRAAVHAYCRVIDEHREAALLGYRETRSLSKALTKGLMAKETKSTELIGERVTECIEAGVFRRVDVAMMTYHIVVFVHSWALNAWRLKGQFEREAYVDAGLDMLLGPILQAAPPAKRSGPVKPAKTAAPSARRVTRRAA